MPIKETRGLLNAALDGSLKTAAYREDPLFGFMVPVSVPGVDDGILEPRSTWTDPAAYDAQADKLVAMFLNNFKKFEDHVAAYVRAAAPKSERVQEKDLVTAAE